MKKTTSFIFACLLIGGLAAAAAQPIEIELRELFQKSESELPLNELIQISGNVLLHVDDGRETTNLYVLRGDHGQSIYVRTTKELSPVNQRIEGLCGYLYSGRIFTDPRTQVTETGLFVIQAPCSKGEMYGDMVMVQLNTTPAKANVYVNGEYIGTTPIVYPMKSGAVHRIEFERTWYRSVTYSGFVPTTVRASIEETLHFSYLLYALIFGGIILISGLVYRLVSRGGNGGEPPTVIIPKHVDNDKTVTWLKGYFKVLEGDLKEYEIKMVVPVDNRERAQFTIGRSQGNKYTHIHLTDPSVSREQARLTYHKGKYQLSNRVPEDRNPTLVNGKTMILNEARELQNGDIVQFGKVKLEFVLSS